MQIRECVLTFMHKTLFRVDSFTTKRREKNEHRKEKKASPPPPPPPLLLLHTLRLIYLFLYHGVLGAYKYDGLYAASRVYL